jgi:hypothetical protein
MSMGTHFTAETSHGRLEEAFCIFLRKFDAIRNTVKFSDSYCACAVEAVCDADWMDTPVEQAFTLF